MDSILLENTLAPATVSIFRSAVSCFRRPYLLVTLHRTILQAVHKAANFQSPESLDGNEGLGTIWDGYF